MGGAMAKYTAYTLLLTEETGTASSRGNVAESTQVNNTYTLQPAFPFAGIVPTGVHVH